MLLNRVWVFQVAVPMDATPPFGFELVPALKNFSVRAVLSSANDPVPQVRIVARGSLKPLFAPSTLPDPKPLTPKYPR